MPAVQRDTNGQVVVNRKVIEMTYSRETAALEVPPGVGRGRGSILNAGGGIPGPDNWLCTKVCLTCSFRTYISCSV